MDIVPIDMGTVQSVIKINKQNIKNDLEDILQYVCAKDSGCEIIVTNDKNFYVSEISTMSIEKLFVQ